MSHPIGRLQVCAPMNLKKVLAKFEKHREFYQAQRPKEQPGPVPYRRRPPIAPDNSVRLCPFRCLGSGQNISVFGCFAHGRTKVSQITCLSASTEQDEPLLQHNSRMQKEEMQISASIPVDRPRNRFQRRFLLQARLLRSRNNNTTAASVVRAMVAPMWKGLSS